jgi:cytidylate kinase
MSARSIERLAGALEHAYSHFQERKATQAESAENAFTIALSREAGIPSTTVAHEVGVRLGWPVYDHELLERIAEEMNLQPSVLQTLDERPAHWLVERMETFLASPPVSEPRYVEHLIATLLSLSAHGQCVVVGRGASHLLPMRSTLRVRLVAPLEDCITAMSQELGISLIQAAKRVANVDRERNEFVRKHFHQDATDPHQYDLMVNCTRFRPAECAAIISEGLHCLQSVAAGE